MSASDARPGLSWSGTVDYGPGPLHAPRTVAELQQVVARAGRIRALGTRHSFSRVAASDADLVTLAGLPEEIEVDSAARTVRVTAGVRYGTLALELARHGLALANTGSLPHISVAGASATGTHGSGDRNQALAASVRAIDLVTAGGDIVSLSREGDEAVFGGAVLALGALGVATHLTLDVVPAFDVRQRVYLDLPAEELRGAGLDAVLAGAYSVSIFHHWDGTGAQIWAKQAVLAGDAAQRAAAAEAAGTPGLPTDPESPFPEVWHGARLASGPMHPLPGMPGDFCTDQTGAPGPSHERLPHFRLEFTPSNGEEIQSEYYVPRAQIADALAAVMPLGERIRPLLHASEVRTVAADDLWLSPAHDRDSALVHFTWKQMPDEVEALLPEIEAALAPFSPRPHWGKVFTTPAEEVRACYPRLAEFQALAERLDPQGTFRNAYVETYLF
ncbi:FAD-binding protein [Brachybacterium phenoliresistens]|uniref:FAD-binding protein n=1 Tax=Brachybacterium phenoliresistens TaxID=396014 RepID=Z9JQQ7_9MICO|nr:D-arabinono-1,4-lactone oxidase [Brachybacterium phenoliresistens]EWS80373.1 FAD-binding protein [Brachybacterium phenoliresistens]